MIHDTSGLTSPRQFVFFDRAESCWRTWPGISLWGSEVFSQTWPKRGSMRNGACFEHPTWEPAIGGHGCLSLLPTPTTSDTNGAGLHGNGGIDLRTTVRLLPTPRAQNGEARNDKVWARPLDQPQNLENALARLPGASTSLPSADGNTFWDDPHPHPPTTETDSPHDSSSG